MDSQIKILPTPGLILLTLLLRRIKTIFSITIKVSEYFGKSVDNPVRV